MQSLKILVHRPLRALGFLWEGSRRGGALVSPALHAHVAQEFSREAALQKEKRKALEARKAQVGGGRAPKGAGKGGNPEAPPGK